MRNILILNTRLWSVSIWYSDHFRWIINNAFDLYDSTPVTIYLRPLVRAVLIRICVNHFLFPLRLLLYLLRIFSWGCYLTLLIISLYNLVTASISLDWAFETTLDVYGYCHTCSSTNSSVYLALLLQIM